MCPFNLNMMTIWGLIARVILLKMCTISHLECLFINGRILGDCALYVGF